MSKRTNRRDAFRRLLHETVRGAQEVAGPLLPGEVKSSKPVTPSPRPRRETVVAPPAHSSVGCEELLRLASTLGLAERLAEVRSLARPSLRATLPSSGEPPTGRSQLGGEPDLPSGTEWPSWNSEPLAFVAQLDLAAVGGPILGSSPLPGPGLLLIFCAASLPSGLDPDHAGSCRVIWVPAQGRPPLPRPADEVNGRPGRPILLTPEVVFPRPWSDAVNALGLTEGERIAWADLRRELASAQGVQLHDEVRGFLAVHRVFGYADERRGDMRLACELLARGANLEGRGVRTHPMAASVGTGADRWQLLLQLSRDATLSSIVKGDWERLYLWVDAAALEVRDFSAVRVIRR